MRHYLVASILKLTYQSNCSIKETERTTQDSNKGSVRTFEADGAHASHRRSKEGMNRSAFFLCSTITEKFTHVSDISEN